jgi:pseudouridine synthase
LNKFIAESGHCSRRHADELISEGKVEVNGEVCTTLSTQINPEQDKIICEGKRLSANRHMIYILVNKPRGFPVTKSDEFKRKTVYSLLPKEYHVCKYAGRLDMDSEGLLLMTNDGDLIQSLSHPSMKVEKVYRVDVNQKLSRMQLEQLRKGVEIEGKKTYPAGVFLKSSDEGKTTLKMVITEGRKRQIRLMLEAVGARVTNLRRLQYGPLKLGELQPGEWRLLNRYEIHALRKINKDK